MIVRVSSRGRIVIPTDLRQQLGIRVGTRIHIQSNKASITLTPITHQYIHSLRGKYRGRGLLKALTKERQAERRQ